VVTGRKEDVALAKREILSAADHFSQIRASRSKNGQGGGINSTLAFGQMVANQPGQTTTQVRVPYRVVGLVVGPKGATIKRIQQATHTYIVTPSRDKEPVFEVTGLPENVDAARKEIEAHIAMRTGADSLNGGSGGGPNGIGNIYGIGEHPLNHVNNGGDNSDGNSSFNGSGGFNSAFSSSSGHLDNAHNQHQGSGKYNSILNGHYGGQQQQQQQQHQSLHSQSSLDFGLGKSGSGGGGLILQNLLDDIGSSNANGHHHHNPLTGTRSGGPGLTAWSSNGGTEENNGASTRARSPLAFESNGRTVGDLTGTAIWGDVNKCFGGLDLNGGDKSQHSGQHHAGGSRMMSLMNAGNGVDQQQQQKSAFLSVGSRSSLDLGTLGQRQTQHNGLTGGESSLAPGSAFVNAFNSAGCSATSSTSSSRNNADTPPGGALFADHSPPSSLPFSASAAAALGQHRASVSSEPSGLSYGGNKEHQVATAAASSILADENSTEGIDQ